MRIALITFLMLSLVVPAMPVDGLLLVCPDGDKPPMALHECCCVVASSASSDAECELLRLADCCCEIRPDWRIETETKEVVPLPTTRLDAPSLYLVQQRVVSREIRPSFTIHESEDYRPSGPPSSLFLLHRSLLI